MWSGSWKGTGYLVVALLPAACPAADPSQICSDWQAKFHHVQASWLPGATTRAEVERIFGIPARTEAQGACTQLNYAAAGCSCWFTVCSQGTVVSKTLTIGAAAAPIFLTEDPAALTEAVTALQENLRDLQAEVGRLQQTLETLAPAPAPGPVSPPPPRPAAARSPPAPAAAARCAALTKKGTQCTRRAVSGSAYCWQHKGGS